MSATHDLVVVSDLHIGRGVNPETRRFFPLETFFFDDDFTRFVRWLIRRAGKRERPFKLIINGDCFDFLRIHDEVDGSKGDASRRFSQELSPATAATLVAEILMGHPGFAAALATVVDSGNELVILPGNHDLEVHWTEVQDAIRGAVQRALTGADESSIGRLSFPPWFYFEPGRIWIEHGCQYDPENAFRYPLRGRLGDDPGFTPEGEVDLPLGNFFQRYLYNAFGSITFIVPTSRANGRYFKWLMLNEPRLLLRVATSHIPFAIQMLRRLATGGKERKAAFKAAHDERLAGLAVESGLGDRLGQIDGLKATGADAVLAVDAIIRGATRLIVRAAMGLLLFGTAWITAGQAISSLSLGFGVKAILSVMLNVVVVTAAIGVAAYQALRLPPDHTPRPLKRAAERITALADVPLVLFGHTHEEVLFPLTTRPSSGERAWYFNSGTWIAVFTHDVLLPRERVQFSFIDVVGSDATLMHWSSTRDAAVPVVLIDEAGKSPD